MAEKEDWWSKMIDESITADPEEDSATEDS